MSFKKQIMRPTLIPCEAVRLGGFVNADNTKTVKEIYAAFEDVYSDIKVSAPCWYSTFLLLVCWNAGRIEGIRAERARRNKTT